MVELDGDIRLPEGARVRIDVIEDSPQQPSTAVNGPTIWDELLKLAGKAEGLPSDYASQHDHYLYGTPKR